MVWREIQQVSFFHVILRKMPLILDIILVRMVADPTKAVEKQHGYRNALHGVYKMVQQEGPSSLARGLMPNTVCSRLLATYSDLMTDPCCSHERIPARLLRFLQRISSILWSRQRHATPYPIVCIIRYSRHDNMCACRCGEE